MQLSPLVCALNSLVFACELHLLRGDILVIESVVAVAVGDAGFSDLLVADQDDLPGVVRDLVRKAILLLARAGSRNHII